MDSFKTPSLPSSLGKRPTSSRPDDAPNGKGKQRATVEDEDDEAGIRDEEMYTREEDEDGRFFGGGLNDEQRTILDIMDTPDDVLPDALTVQGVRRQLLALERAINKNAEMRAKWPADPLKFVDSEIALDTQLRALVLLTQDPANFYPEFIKLKTAASLCELLAHDNGDIAIALISVLEELTDEDVTESEGEQDDDSARQAVLAFVDALIESSILPLSVQNLDRLSDTEEQERQGIYHTFSLLENLLSLLPDLSSTIITSTPLLTYLLNKISKPGPPETDQNRFYAAELLAILLSGDAGHQARLALSAANGVQILLEAVSKYRRQDPSSGEEIEYMENLFDSICSALIEPKVRQSFIDGEGVELMVLVMKQKNMSRTRAIKVLDYALQGSLGSAACTRFVDALGLKTIFAAWMSSSSSKKDTTTMEDETHVIGVMASLFSSLESDSDHRTRLLSKFVEKDYEKVDRLVDLRDAFDSRIRARESDIAEEQRILEAEGLELDADDIYLRKLDSGLFTLQMIDYILAWIIMEDDGIRDHIKMLFSRRDLTFAAILTVLDEYGRNIGDTSTTNGTNGHSEKEPTAAELEADERREIVAQLMQYIAELLSIPNRS